MKRLIALAAVSAAVAVACAGPESSRISKEEVRTEGGKQTVKVEEKAVDDPKGLGNSTTDTAKFERTTEVKPDGGFVGELNGKAEHDAPGSENDWSSSVREKVVKDGKTRSQEREVTTN